MALVQRVRCVFGRHLRSARDAHWHKGYLRSHCSGCRVEMMKGLHGWTTQREDRRRLQRRAEVRQQQQGQEQQ